VQFAWGWKEKVPGGQGMQASERMKVPEGHEEHTAWPSTEKFPPAHGWQLEALVLPEAGFAVPAGHGTHPAWPVVGLKEPAMHTRQLERLADRTFGL
jgi:hypothetical protein